MTSFDPSEANNLAYDNNNIAAGVPPVPVAISTFYTMLDNQRLQEFNLDCSTGDDYMLLEKKLAGSVIQNMNIYNYNWFFVDDFSESEKLYEKDWNQEVGLPLDTEKKYEVYLTTTGNLNNYAFATFQKMLSVTSAGISVTYFIL